MVGFVDVSRIHHLNLIDPAELCLKGDDAFRQHDSRTVIWRFPWPPLDVLSVRRKLPKFTCDCYQILGRAGLALGKQQWLDYSALILGLPSRA